MSEAYQVAIAGCGRRSAEFAKELQADSRCRVVALADPDTQAAETLNADFGFGADVYPDHHALLDKARPDIVVTVLWTPLHLRKSSWIHWPPSCADSRAARRRSACCRSW
ncbi:MAG: Gfo/Idh/MocA family oxidoreductase [Phycisphaerae bacterium]|nr:Gfo/Idh/MocA family oxidoreductase [Phycisphaerae bacterium]